MFNEFNCHQLLVYLSVFLTEHTEQDRTKYYVTDMYHSKAD